MFATQYLSRTRHFLFCLIKSNNFLSFFFGGAEKKIAKEKAGVGLTFQFLLAFFPASKAPFKVNEKSRIRRVTFVYARIEGFFYFHEVTFVESLFFRVGCDTMKVTSRHIDKDRSGQVTIVPEEMEDMWHIYNLLQIDDRIKATAVR